jgi:hypothetical protein
MGGLIAMTEAVISCPRCGRQYAVDSTLAGKLAQCRACKCTFNISLATLAFGEPEITLVDEIIVRVNFLREACVELAKSASELLRMAGEPVTQEAAMEIAKSIPRNPKELLEDSWRRGRCSRTMERVHPLNFDSTDPGRYKEILEYFASYIPTRDLYVIDVLQSAFQGVLSIEFDVPRPEPVPEPPISVIGRASPALRVPSERKPL